MLTYNCNEPVYVKLVEALYAENYINLIRFMSTWNKTDQERNPIKWLIAVVWGLQISQAKNVKENFKYKNEQQQNKNKNTLAHFLLNKQKKRFSKFYPDPGMLTHVCNPSTWRVRRIKNLRSSSAT